MQALEELGIKEDTNKDLEKLIPVQIPVLLDSKFAKGLVSSQLVTAEELSKYNTILIILKTATLSISRPGISIIKKICSAENILLLIEKK
jgi:hypothetical protein